MSTQWQTLKPSDILSSEQSHALRQRSDIKGLLLIIHCWAVIAGTMALYVIFPNPITLLIGIILVGGRQLGLAILMHEGSHGMLFKSRNLNERLTQWLTAWPMILDVKAYRIRHMAHHRFTRTDKDPENFLYTPFPVTRPSMARKFLRDLTGIVFVRGTVGLFSYIRGSKEGRTNRLLNFYGGPIVFNVLMALAFASAGRIDLFLLLWLLPMATSYQLFLRIRNIAEHSTMPSLSDPLQNSRTTMASLLARTTVAPYWVNYHIEHHLMPYVPCYRLPEIHRILIEKGYGDRMEIQQNYRDVLRLNASA
ncbi:MAG: fatty acid desaturase family protein [Kordiimonadaceae bacterium]|nr:fatty acid desaturase family protein [Kordiimonadaceae bacterium]